MEVTCRACKTTVLPLRQINWLLLAALTLLVWPIALVYILAKWKPDGCPACGGNVYQPRYERQSRSN